MTCRRWNWRQGRRTALTDTTSSAVFILDALTPLSDEALAAAADDFTEHLLLLGADVQVARRLLSAAAAGGT